MLGEQIDHVGRQGPAEFEKTAKFGRGVVGDERRPQTRIERGSIQGEQLVTPESDFAPAAKLAADHADRPRAFAGVAKIELEVYRPKLTKHDAKGLGRGTASRWGVPHYR